MLAASFIKVSFTVSGKSLFAGGAMRGRDRLMFSANQIIDSLQYKQEEISTSPCLIEIGIGASLQLDHSFLSRSIILLNLRDMGPSLISIVTWQ